MEKKIYFFCVCELYILDKQTFFFTKNKFRLAKSNVTFVFASLKGDNFL